MCPRGLEGGEGGGLTLRTLYVATISPGNSIQFPRNSLVYEDTIQLVKGGCEGKWEGGCPGPEGGFGVVKRRGGEERRPGVERKSAEESHRLGYLKTSPVNPLEGVHSGGRGEMDQPARDGAVGQN